MAKVLARAMRFLLLDGVGAIVAIVSAHAVDLPMTRREAIEYVKTCSKFGPGFFHIPGNGGCIKISSAFDFDTRPCALTEGRYRGELVVQYWNRESGCLRVGDQLSVAADGTLALNPRIAIGGLSRIHTPSFFGDSRDKYESIVGKPD